MVRIFPLIFILLWSSAFITTKPIVDNSDPFAALAFRFFFVALGFYLFSLYSNHSIFIKQKNLIESVLSGVLFHGLYLGGVFYSLDLLPDFWAMVSRANPLVYVVNAFRYGMLGVSDVNITVAFSMIIAFVISAYLYSLYLLNSGKRLRR